jgi:hypothetical protein
MLMSEKQVSDLIISILLGYAPNAQEHRIDQSLFITALGVKG